MKDSAYAAFAALDPFFDVVQKGLEGLVDGQHFFDTVADEAIFEFRYHFPGWPQKLGGRGELMALYAGYGDNIILHDADGKQDATTLGSPFLRAPSHAHLGAPQ
jgi:uncharacterized protein